MSTRPASFRPAWAGTLRVAVLLLVVGACGGEGSRRSESGQVPPRRLDGAWELTLRLDRRMSLSATPATLPFTVKGTVTMMSNERADVSFASLADPTEIGVYALRLDSLGLLSLHDGEMPTLAARERLEHPTRIGTARDSILIVLNPGTPGRMIRLAGALAGDVARGEWTAESPLGGGGMFEMRRVVAAPVATP